MVLYATSTRRRAAIPSATARSSVICSLVGFTWHPASSRRCSSPSRTATRRLTGRSTPLPISGSPAGLWETIAAEAGRESELWTVALRAREEQERDPIFSLLGEERYALGIETIYEGYLLHY